jgi:hypothetical protein
MFLTPLKLNHTEGVTQIPLLFKRVSQFKNA